MPEDWGDSADKAPSEDWGDSATPIAPTAFDRSQTFASGQFIRQYEAKQLEELRQPGPGFMAGLPALGRLALGFPEAMVSGMIDGLTNSMMTSHKALTQALTPEEEYDFATNNMAIAFGMNELPKFPKAKTVPVTQQFHDEVAKPVVEKGMERAELNRIVASLQPEPLARRDPPSSVCQGGAVNNLGAATGSNGQKRDRWLWRGVGGAFALVSRSQNQPRGVC